MWRDGTNISLSGGRIGSHRLPRPSYPLSLLYPRHFLRTLLPPPRPRRRYPHRSRYLCTILRSYRDPCYLRRGSLRALRSHSLASDRSRDRIRLHSLLHPRLRRR